MEDDMEEVQSAVESEMSGHLKEKLKVASLCDEWGSSKGGLSTLNRQLCISMAKQSVLEVSCFLPEVSDSDKNAASKDKVTLIEADPRDPLVKLQHSPAEQSFPDVIISHGRKFGPGALRIKEGHPNCTWVHFVHVDYREMGKNKKPGSNEINVNNTKDNEELDFCKDADIVVAVGPQLLDRYTRSLSRKGKKVHVFYPGLSDEFEHLPVKDVENDKFHIYLFGRCSSQDFELKGVDLIADAVKNLGEDYNLHIVGVPEGEEENIQQQILKTTRIKMSQLFVKSYCKNRDEMKDLMCEADMVVMPSRAEAYGMIGVEALSAGVPLLVSAASGLGMT